jgi:hypothetical protein
VASLNLSSRRGRDLVELPRGHSRLERVRLACRMRAIDATTMVERIATAKVRLVTIIASSELQDRVIEDLREAGAGGYTIGRASGGGLHGPRVRGVFDSGNVRIESVVSGEVAERVLEHLAQAYAGLSLIAFTQDVEAVPREHFLRPSRGPRL